MVVETNEIRDLEKKYIEIIGYIFDSEKFKKNLSEVKDYIQIQYENLGELWAKKNKVNVAVERLIRYHLYSDLVVTNIYPSVLSPDMAVELEDVILCVDAKTIDMVGNAGDDRSIHFQQNQITFDNKPLFGQYLEGIYWPGVNFSPQLEKEYKGKPCLSYFITVNYEDDFGSFRLSHASICCVPHAQIVEDEFNNDIISNYKTYAYLNKTQAKLQGENFLPVDKPRENWIPFKLKTKLAYLDTTISNPEENIFFVRKEEGGKWKIVSSGLSARIDKQTIKTRSDSNRNKWDGVIKVNLAGYEN